MTTATHTQTGGNQRLAGGVAGGLAGGAVFGAMMGAMGMLPMVAGLVGSTSAAIGFVVHMVISAIIGAGFALLFGERARTTAQGAIWGLGYGIIWWVLGPLVLMPLMMGMPLQFGAAFSGPMLMSLLGHALYGVVLGAVFALIARR